VVPIGHIELSSFRSHSALLCVTALSASGRWGRGLLGRLVGELGGACFIGGVSLSITSALSADCNSARTDSSWSLRSISCRVSAVASPDERVATRRPENKTRKWLSYQDAWYRNLAPYVKSMARWQCKARNFTGKEFDNRILGSILGFYIKN